MYYSDDIIEQVRSSNDIVDLISGYVKLTRKGSNHFGLCPFHNEKSPSFCVNQDKQMYYCFGCGAGGNSFTFLMEYENFSFQEAVKYLADRSGITLPEEKMSGEARKEADMKRMLLEINKEAAKYYYMMLYSPRGKIGLDYFRNRKLSPEIMKQFGLGFSDKYSDDLYKYLKHKDYSDELLRESGLFYYDERHGMTDKFWNRVMFPIMDINNKVIAFGGRVLGDGKPKYLNSPETMIFDKGRNLYGLHLARKTKEKKIILCEGYMDVISLHQAGFSMAVASLGTAFTVGQASLLKRYAQGVYLVYDSDAAGVKAILRALPILRNVGLDGYVVNLEPYKDPDEFIKNRGPEAFRERLDQAENGFLFAIRMLEKEYNIRTPEGRTHFYRAVAEEMLVFDEELERDSYIMAVAEKYMIPSADLKKLVGQAAMKGINVPQREQIIALKEKKTERKSEDGLLQAQKLLLTWIIEIPSLYEEIKKYLSPGDFTSELYREVASMLYEQAEKGKMIPASIISHFADENDQREVARLFNTHLPAEERREREKAIKEAVIRVKKGSIDRMSDSLNPLDLEKMQKLVASRKALQDLNKITISIK